MAQSETPVGVATYMSWYLLICPEEVRVRVRATPDESLILQNLSDGVPIKNYIVMNSRCKSLSQNLNKKKCKVCFCYLWKLGWGQNPHC